jgi:hypothetical protein
MQLSFTGYLTLIFLLIFLTINDNFYQKSYAHSFFVNNDATLVTLIEQIKAETQLVNTNFLSSNNISAQVHAQNAAKLLNIMEDNLTQGLQPSSDIAQIYDNGQRNSTTLALVVANIVDEILRKYGKAFDIGYDLTNMSNMGGMTMPNMDMDMTTFSPNSNTLEEHSNMSSMMTMTEDSVIALVDIHEYESAQVLANNINVIFEEDLRPQSSVSETVNIDKLERNLKQLEYAINNKASPEVLMKIVHVQIHPTLQLVYDLKLLENAVITEISD